MKAAYLTDIRRIEVRTAAKPAIRNADDVLLRVEVVGVCGSDVHYFKEGRIGQQVVQFPWIVGHEFSATVMAVGPEAANLRPGTRVAVDPLIWCGQCDQCLQKRVHTCRNQRFLGCPGQAAGSLAEYVVMPGRCCYAVDSAMSATQAALVEPLSVGLYATRLAGLPAESKVGILGSGPIGLSVLMSLRAAGLCEVCVTDLLPERLAVAMKLGAAWTGNPRRQDVVADVLARQPLGLDCVFECAGQQETIDQAVQLLRPGGTLLLVGIPEVDRISFAIDQIRRKELRLLNVRRQNECVQPAIDMIRDGRADVSPLATHHFTLDQTQEAFDLVAGYRDGVIKAMIHVA